MGTEEGPEWRERVDSVVLYDKIEDLRQRIKELERVIHGGRDSLLSEYRRHDQELTRIHAVLFQDSTGQKGLFHDVDVLMGRRKDDNQTTGLKWQFWGAIVVAVISATALVLTNLPKIKVELLRIDPLEKPIEQAKHPKGKKVIHIRLIPSQESPPSESSKESPPNSK